MDWEKHFRRMKKSDPRAGTTKVSFGADPDFGEVLGMHTIADIKHILNAQQYFIDQTEKAYNANAFELSKKPENQLWLADWRIMKARWESAKKKAQAAIDSWRLLPDSASPAEAEYIGLLQAVQLSYPVHHVSYGDLTDLIRRLGDMGVSGDYSNTPQPDPGDDFDLNVIKTLEPVNVIQKASDAVSESLEKNKKTWVIVGVLAAGTGLFLLPKVLRAFVPIRF